MEFKLQSVRYWEDVPKILETYPTLNSMNIRIEKYLDYYKEERERLFITLDSIEELMDLKKSLGKEIILYGDKDEMESESYEPTLQIYDDWRE